MADATRAPARRRLAFISYRQSDSLQATQGLHAELRQRFGSSHVFMDVNTIRPGGPFPAQIEAALSNATVLLAVIGPSWLTASDEYGRRRLDRKSDWVRSELLHGLRRPGLPVIPLLVAGAKVPPRAGLPKVLAGLADHPARTLRDKEWKDDLASLVALLKDEHGFVESQARHQGIGVDGPRVSPRPLADDELYAALEGMPGWAAVESDVPGDYPKTRHEIRRVYEFASFAKAIEFMHEAAPACDRFKPYPHHPRWENQYKTLTVWVTTWDIGFRVSELDLGLARALDVLYARRGAGERA